MAKRTEPTISEFDDAEQLVLDVLSTSSPGVMTKTGSVIRELVVRPLAYLYAWATKALSDTIRTSTVAYLRTSQKTDNETADAVASNYFVERRQGMRSKGSITIVCSSPSVQLPSGTVFTVDGAAMRTTTRVVAMGGSHITSDNVTYVPMVAYADGTYTAMIPVEASTSGKLEISPGATVTMGFLPGSILSAELTAPITGGSDTETDAELMERARHSTASGGVGSYYGLRRKLDLGPVNVLGLSVVAGESPMMWRARRNSVNVSPGGFVDCYVKTQNQRASSLVVGELVRDYMEEPGDGYYVYLLGDGGRHAGAYGVSKVVCDGYQLEQYTLLFESSDPTVGPEGARLGRSQRMLLAVSSDDSEQLSGSSSAPSVSAEISYMPGISEIQDHMDSEENRFVGMDVMVKAAVPVILRLACVLDAGGSIDDASLSAVRQAMADTVNSYPVGTSAFNFSDLEKAVRGAVSGATLRLPCTVAAETPTIRGGTARFSSETGVLDMRLEEHNTGWDTSAYFFCLSVENIDFDIM